MPSITSPTPSSPPPPTHPNIPPLPSPSTFSILPDLYLLLSRLSPLHKPISTTTATTINTNGTTTNPQTDPSPTQAPFLPLTTTPSNSTSTQLSIDLKDLPTLIYPIKQKILRAKEAIEMLPDIERSITEQEQEMRVLEERIGGLKGRLVELGVIAGRGRGSTIAGQKTQEVGNADVTMQSVER